MGVRRALVPPSRQPQELTITDACGSTGSLALGAHPVSATGDAVAIRAAAEFSGRLPHLPVSPAVGANASSVPLLKARLLTPWRSLRFMPPQGQFCYTKISVISVTLWKWKGMAGARPPAQRVSSRAQTDRCDALRDVCHIEEVVLLSRPF